MKKLLIADDLPDTVEMLSTFLQNNGYEVYPAYDGEEALRVAQNRIPDALILDIGMPKLDGFEVAQQIRNSSLSGALIIGYSGYTEQKFFERATECCLDFYLPKPADPGLLLACLEPESFPSFLADSVIVRTSRNLRKTSQGAIARGQALSFQKRGRNQPGARNFCRRTTFSQ